MELKRWFVFFVGAALIGHAPLAKAGVSYKDPEGGWSYLYDGIMEDIDLDGTWDHNNGSDAWDELGIGEDVGAPGGVEGLEDGGVTYLRMQDTGDPRDDGFADPSNRKFYGTHDINDDDPDGELVISGVTLTFRTRLATSGLLDGDVPEEGDGYYILDGGKGTFGIRSDVAAAVISFAPSTSSGDDLAENATGALLMNNYDPAGGTDVNSNGGGEHNEFAVDDWTDWNEFWVTIQEADEFNEYLINIYANGATTAEEFLVTGGPGNDGSFGSYIAMGTHSTGQSGAIDVDFFGFKPGILTPEAADVGGVAGDYNLNGVRDVEDIDLLTAGVNAGDLSFDLNEDGAANNDDRVYFVETLSNTYFGDSNFDGEFSSADFVTVFVPAKYETGQAATFAQGDWNGDGTFDSADFVTAFVGAGYEGGPRDGGLMTTPEPSSLVLLLSALIGLAACRRR